MRLLSRLRSRHAKSSRKSTRSRIIPKLDRAADLLRQIENHSARAKTLKVHASKMLRDFHSLEALGTSDSQSSKGRVFIKSILLSVEALFACDKQDLAWLPASIPKAAQGRAELDLGPLVQNLKRLDQYQHASHYLLRMARRTRTFQHLDIQEVCTGPFPSSRVGFELPSTTKSYLAGLLATQTKRGRTLARRIESHLSTSLDSIRVKVETHIQANKRVHAEIQLLFHYEAKSDDRLRPRVICSNKHACFLCNLYVTVHGSFYIPGSHGKLYPQWRIPRPDELHLSEESTQKMTKCLERFNQALESHIRTFLSRQLSRLPDANESILFYPGTVTPSVATVRSDVSEICSRAGSLQISHGCLTGSEVCSLHTSPFASTPQSCAIVSSYASDLHDRESALSLNGPLQDPDVPLSPILAVESSPTSVPGSIAATKVRSFRETGSYSIVQSPTAANSHASFQESHLIQGLALSLQIDPGMTFRFITPRIHLELSYVKVATMTPDGILFPGSSIALHVEWINAATAYEHEPNNNTVNLDLQFVPETMPPGVLYEIGGIAIRRKDTTIVLRAEQI